MANITGDGSKLFFVASHPNLGDISDNENLTNVISEPLSDISEVRDPGVGGGRIMIIKADKGRRLSIECGTGSPLDTYLRRCIRYRFTEFTCNWSDERFPDVQSGQGRQCKVSPNAANDRQAETMTYEIISLDYSGD